MGFFKNKMRIHNAKENAKLKKQAEFITTNSHYTAEEQKTLTKLAMQQAAREMREKIYSENNTKTAANKHYNFSYKKQNGMFNSEVNIASKHGTSKTNKK